MSPGGQPELESGSAAAGATGVRGDGDGVGEAQPLVGASAPGYPAKKFSRLRFS